MAANAVAVVLNKATAPYILAGAYIVMHCTVLSSYVPTPESSETVKLLAASQWFVPTLLLAVLVPRVSRFLTPILKIQFWTAVGSIFVLGCIALQLLGVPGLWWAWSTMGLLTVVVIVVANATTHRLGQTNAWLLGVMVMFLGMAYWEALYQTGLLFYHDFFGSRTINYVIVIAEQLTWIIPALIVILVLHKRFGRIVHNNAVGPLCIALSLMLTTVWFANGMQIPLIWHQGLDGIVGPFPTNADRWAISVSRGSQGFWLLGVATLFMERKNVQRDSL